MKKSKERYGVYGQGDAWGKEWFIYDHEKGRIPLGYGGKPFKTKRAALKEARQLNTKELE